MLEVVELEPQERASASSTQLLEEFTIARLRKARPRSRSRAASAAAARSRRALAGTVRPSSCSTSRSPASTRSRSAKSEALVRHLTDRGIGVLITDHNVRETLGLVDRAYIILLRPRADRRLAGRDHRRTRCAPRLSGRGFPALTVSCPIRVAILQLSCAVSACARHCAAVH